MYLFLKIQYFPLMIQQLNDEKGYIFLSKLSLDTMYGVGGVLEAGGMLVCCKRKQREWVNES